MSTLERAKSWARRLVRRAILAVSSADRHEQMEGHEADPDDPEYQHPVMRFQWYGHRSRPGAGTELITLAPEGGTSQRVAVAGEAPGTGPTDQPEWENEIYCKFGQRIIQDKDGHMKLLVADGKELTIQANQATIKIDGAGKITIDSKAGQDVQVNGGTSKVAREGDAVKQNAAMKTWMDAVTTATGVAPLVGVDIGTNNGGASRFKG